ncbi:phage structural protein [Clostridioides difficile]|nr:phage structural protein [Clostridioides difficile]VHU85010.1 phage structural protein [Clostridioides difficile]
MMEKSFVFNSINGDRRYKAEDFREYFASFIGNGVFPNPSTNLQVVDNNNMTITVKKGKGWINGAIYINTDDLVINIDAADGILNRIDRVVLRFDTLNRNIKLAIKKGTFNSSPAATELQRDADAYELGLADIYIKAGAISITQSSITDLRLDKNLCGIVKGTVEEIDTTTLLAQLNAWKDEEISNFNAWRENQENKQEDWYNTTTTNFVSEFNTWFESIKDILDGDAAGNLLNEINKVKEDLASIEITAQRATVEDAENLFEADSQGNKNVEIALNQLAKHYNSLAEQQGNLEIEVNGQRVKGITIVNNLIDMI